MRSIKCCKCEKEATFTSPSPLCDEHWAEWWLEGYPNRKRDKAMAETIKLITAVQGCRRMGDSR